MEDDGWEANRQRLLSSAKLAEIGKVLRDEGPIVLEHWFYRGARAPSRLIFDEYDAFEAYLEANARPGDAFYAWSYVAVCRGDNRLADWKSPDEFGRTPARGPY
jgi:hypothetical protein